ncbi:hypothetical protein TRIUR3_03971 [Triticum urartu]|uniref:Neprosin PEP catalytic domain-containing protein n=1 Tax=Triticum urartu TaxID=4572 RepID=M8ABP7_TRIUA|nr:hypothetical protein TRIUR3_03971 [Triticum urartu]
MSISATPGVDPTIANSATFHFSSSRGGEEELGCLDEEEEEIGEEAQMGGGDRLCSRWSAVLGPTMDALATSVDDCGGAATAGDGEEESSMSRAVATRRGVATEEQVGGGEARLCRAVLVTRGKDVQYRRQQEDNTQILTYHRVNKTIVMKDGDVYDCIDVNEQPAFKHPLLKDHKVQMQPNHFPIWMDIQTLPSDEPSILECPTGTIPILRTNGSGTIAAHSYDGQLESAGLIYQGDVYGVRGVLNVWEPKYDGLYKKSCIDFSCPSFVQVSHKVGLGARMRPPSVYHGKQTVIHIQIFKDPMSKNWWLTYEHVAIGYWPSALFEFLRNKGDAAFWGGIVEGPTASSNSP